MNFNYLRWVYLVGFFLILALPLLNLPPWFSPPDWGKTIVFRIILSFLIFLFICQLLSRRNSAFSTIVGNTLSGGVKRNLAFWGLAALFLIFLLSTIFSLDPRFSFWGSPYRSGGFLNFTFYIIFAILTFFVVRREDWRKIWDFSIFVGIFVSLIAILQQFGLLKETFISFIRRPPSTVGGPIFLAIYLLLLSFLSLSFGINSKDLKKRFFYFFSFSLFLLVAIFITQTRAVFIGLTVGFFWFLFFYPTRIEGPNLKKMFLLKIFGLVFLLSGIFGIYFVKNHPQIYAGQPRIIQELIGRAGSLFSGLQEIDPGRISGWKVSLKATKDRPFLGYGPENFAVGFDKHYDPSLPKIAKDPQYSSSWWDRAHNFIFDIGITAGIPALIIYLSLFGILFWQLQKLKKKYESRAVISHGIQSTFLGFLTANLFSFDTFSTYLISFLLIGYSLSLINRGEQSRTVEVSNKKNREKSRKYRTLIMVVLSVLLIWFIWNCNIKPFQINSQINTAKYLTENGRCKKGLAIFENLLPKRSFLDAYFRVKYVDSMRNCEREEGQRSLEFAEKGRKILKESVEIQPYYTRGWILLGGFTNALIEKKTDLIEEETNPEIVEALRKEVQDLKDETDYYFEKASQLSPKRQEVLIEWLKTDFLAGDYEKALEKAQKCIELNPLADCYWYLGLTQIFMRDFEVAKENISIAGQKGYPVDSLIALSQLGKAYTVVKNYQELTGIYEKLALLKPEDPQYHASLAYIYKELGQFEKARKEALIVLELQPETKEEVEEFLKTLP